VKSVERTTRLASMARVSFLGGVGKEWRTKKEVEGRELSSMVVVEGMKRERSERGKR